MPVSYNAVDKVRLVCWGNVSRLEHQGISGMVGDANITADTPLFQTQDFDGNFRPVLRHKFDIWFKHRLAEMGANQDEFTLHAFRHGGIQEVLLAESNYALCRLSSDHASDCILQYSELPAECRLYISDNVNKGLAASAVSASLSRPFQHLSI